MSAVTYRLPRRSQEAAWLLVGAVLRCDRLVCDLLQLLSEELTLTP